MNVVEATVLSRGEVFDLGGITAAVDARALKDAVTVPSCQVPGSNDFGVRQSFAGDVVDELDPSFVATRVGRHYVV
jgi:hypothetical protein